MTGYAKIYNRIVSRSGQVETLQSPDKTSRAARPLGALKAAGRQTGFVNAVEFNLVAALLVFALIISKAVIG